MPHLSAVGISGLQAGEDVKESVPIEQLRLSERRPPGLILSDTPRVRRRIREFGFDRPIPVRPGRGGELEVLGGLREYLAAGRLGISRVPVTVLADLDDSAAEQLVAASYVLTFDDPIEEAEFYVEKLAEIAEDARPSISRLARLTGKGRSYLSRTLALLDLDPEVQRLLIEDRITRTHARHLTTVRSRRRQRALAERIVREDLSERALARLVASVGDAPAPTPAPPTPPTSAGAPVAKDPDTLSLERRVSELLGTPFEIDAEAGVCHINYFGDLSVLDGVLERLGYAE